MAERQSQSQVAEAPDGQQEEPDHIAAVAGAVGHRLARKPDRYGRHRLWPLLGTVAVGFAAAGCQAIPDDGLSSPASQVVECGFNFPPRIRGGVTPAALLGAPFLGEDLGTHGYYLRPSERNGVAYTCRGGHIDTTHVRIAADWTAYLAARSYHHLMRGDRSFSYKLLADRSRHHVHIAYPDNWHSLPPEQRRPLAREAALAMGPYLAFTLVTWHEMLTWYGFRSVGVIGEQHSAFSWEDGYSNLLGTVVAARALRDTQHPYNKAVEIALDEEMRTLGVQPAAVARHASESVRGTWYNGYVGFFVDMKMRNFDVGVDDGLIGPTLVPNVAACPDAAPAYYPAPTLDALLQCGFWAFVEIEPHEWEKGKLLHVIYPNGGGRQIYPATDFAPIMAQIRHEAADKYGPEMAGETPVFAAPNRPAQPPSALVKALKPPRP
jgi:hypothetical protein